MAVCAPNFALGYFGHHSPDRSLPQPRDVGEFVIVRVVELQYNRIGFAAVNAWVRKEIRKLDSLTLGQQLLVAPLCFR
jgi:hypothetical protein